MHIDEPRVRIGHRDSAIARAKHHALKALVVLGGVLMLASAFVISLVFVTIALAVALTVGGYFWWQMREVRKQMRARMQEPLQPAGEIIEGEIISRERNQG